MFGGKGWGKVGVHVSPEVDLRGYAKCGSEHRPNFAHTPASMVDVNNDGRLEVVVTGNIYNCGTSPYTSLYEMPYIFNKDRSRWSGNGFDLDLILSKIDLDRLDKNFPFLLGFVERYQLGGRASVKVEARLSGELLPESLEIWGDLTGTQWVIPSKTGESGEETWPDVLRKSAQLPLTVRARLSAENHEEGYLKVNVESAQLSFAGSELKVAGSTLLEGRGEKVTPLPALPRSSVILPTGTPPFGRLATA